MTNEPEINEEVTGEDLEEPLEEDSFDEPEEDEEIEPEEEDLRQTPLTSFMVQ